MAEGPRVLVISLEAAEPTLLQAMFASGEMPELARIAGRSVALRVAPSAYIGSVPLWPSFATGLPPEQHRRLYGPWLWDPHQMRIALQQPRPVEPMWAARGIQSVGLFDVPSTPAVQPPGGFVIRGWGTHNPMDLEHTIWPPGAAELLGDRHPFKFGTEINTTARRERELAKLGADAIRGLSLRGAAAKRLLHEHRPELAIINFPELHRGGHWLWHTLDRADPLYADLPGPVRELPVGLRELYREADRQIGLLVSDLPAETEVFVFSLVGMEPARGIVDLLNPVLTGTGYARLGDPGTGSAAKRARAAVKAHTPARLKRLYYAALPHDLALRMAELLPAFDWSETRAFAMPSEQHGWIRFNIKGREAAGIVAAADYERLGDELEVTLRALHSRSGEPLVQEILRTRVDDALPDLVVYWTAAAFGQHARLDGREFRARPIVPWLTGQHTMAGVCFAPPSTSGLREVVRPSELQELILDAVLAGSASPR